MVGTAASAIEHRATITIGSVGGRQRGIDLSIAGSRTDRQWGIPTGH